MENIFCFHKTYISLAPRAKYQTYRNFRLLLRKTLITKNIDYQKHRRCLWEIYFVDLGQCGKYILFPQNVYFARAAGEIPNVQKLSPFATQNIDYQKHRRCLWEIYFVDLGQCGKYILFPQNVYFARAAGEMPNV